jgi:MobA/MobL family
MAIFHLSIKPVARSKGQSATAAAAYRAGVKVQDQATRQVFDYTRKRGIEHSEIVLSSEAARRDINWARDRQALWNAAERAEKRKDARVAREYEIALPHELTRQQRVAAVRAFAGELANRYGVAVDFSLHLPHREGDDRNHHAHVLTTTRQVQADGLGAKASIEWSNQDRWKKGLGSAAAEVETVREIWEVTANQHLRAAGFSVRIDRRSLQDQGIDRVPGTHLGVTVWELERRGIETRVGLRVREQQRQEAQRRLERAAELGRLARERSQVEKSIFDLSGDLQRARGQGVQHLSSESGRDISRKAAEAWAAMRAKDPDRHLSPQEIQRRSAEQWRRDRDAGKFGTKEEHESALGDQGRARRQDRGRDDDYGL